MSAQLEYDIIPGVELHLTRMEQSGRLLKLSQAVAQLHIVRYALLAAPDRTRKLSHLHNQGSTGSAIALGKRLEMKVWPSFDPDTETADFIVRPTYRAKGRTYYQSSVSEDYYMAGIVSPMRAFGHRDAEFLSPQSLLEGGKNTAKATEQFEHQAEVAHDYVQKHFAPILKNIEFY